MACTHTFIITYKLLKTLLHNYRMQALPILLIHKPSQY